MGRFVRNFVLLFMALAILYVLVSPLVPTPSAIGKSRQAQVAIIATLLFLFAVPGLRRPAHVIECLDLLRSVEVIELTCTRLC